MEQGALSRRQWTGSWQHTPTWPCETPFSASRRSQGERHRRRLRLRKGDGVRPVDRASVPVPARLLQSLATEVAAVAAGGDAKSGIYGHDDVVTALLKLYLRK